MFEKENQYFPKQTDPQCQLKWNWSTLWLSEGATNSCHRCAKVPLDLDNFDNFHNLPHKINEREIMLSGKWPTVANGGSGHCEYCKSIEDSGSRSDRQNMLEMPNQVPPELLVDPTATSVTPKILEIFMNDTCNLKCTYCNPNHSSQWKSEIRKHGGITYPNGDTIGLYSPTAKRMTKHPQRKQFWEKTKEWMLKNGHELARLHLLGGETFYQSELDEMLDVLEKMQNKHLELNIISNLMVKEDRFKSVIERIKKLLVDRKLGRFDLSASIDGWGPEVEYARTGLKCDHFDKLFSYAVKEKWIVLHTNQTVTSLSVNSIPKLLEKVKEYRQYNKKISLYFGAVGGVPQLHPDVFGSKFWSPYLKKIQDSWPDDLETDKTQKSYMEGVFHSIKNEDPHPQKFLYFKHYLEQLDKRRNTNWRETFPHLNI